MMRLAVLAAFVALASADAVVLTADNFDELVLKSGKNAFVKFYAPWCGHCKAMADDWAKLGSEYDGSNVLIGDVDATIHSDLGSKYDVQGYPTLKYFTLATGAEPQAYSGGRSFADLDTFVKDTLLAKCLIEDESDCTDKEKGYIAKLRKQGKVEVVKQYDRLSKQNPAHLKADLKGWRAQRLHILEQFKAKEQ